MERESYTPSPEDIACAEEFLTEEERRMSEEREEAFARSKVGQLDTQQGVLKYDLDPKLFTLDRIAEEAARQGFDIKDETHATIIGFRNGKKIMKALATFPPEKRGRIVDSINAALGDIQWSLAGATEPILHIKKDYVTLDRQQREIDRETRESYIQCVEIPGIDRFYAHINELLGINLEPPLTHITYATKGTGPKSRMGIGIEGRDELAQLHPTVVSLSESDPPPES